MLYCCPLQYLVEIVMELCDVGTLKQAVLDGRFCPTAEGSSRRSAMIALVRTAKEVAQGM